MHTFDKFMHLFVYFIIYWTKVIQPHKDGLFLTPRAMCFVWCQSNISSLCSETPFPIAIANPAQCTDASGPNGVLIDLLDQAL